MEMMRSLYARLVSSSLKFLVAHLSVLLRSRSRVFEYHNDERARGRTEERTNKGKRISRTEENVTGRMYQSHNTLLFRFSIVAEFCTQQKHRPIDARVVGCNFESRH